MVIFFYVFLFFITLQFYDRLLLACILVTMTVMMMMVLAVMMPMMCLPIPMACKVTD